MTNRAIDQDWEVSQDRPPQTAEGAVLFLRNWLSQMKGKEHEEDTERPLIEVVTGMIKANPEEWWIGHHFGWGMGMRNLLRENGYSEKDLGLGNLDDYYIGWIEQACLGEGKNIHPLPKT